MPANPPAPSAVSSTASFNPANPALGADPETPSCPLCADTGGEQVWRDADMRVVLPDEPDYPGLVRVIWHAHVAEMTDLSPAQRMRLMDVVWRVERALRAALAPDKINLAALGNRVPHLHWHVIARWRDDRHFPASIWSAPRLPDTSATAARIARVAAQRPILLEALRNALG